MCGIAGFIDYGKSLSEVAGEPILNRMMTRINHRGPDDCGLYLESGMGMGNVRLSIIDLSGGDQPLSNEDESLWIVYNGEVFNYIELHDDLVKKGHRFKTHCDTEVILHMYEEYGAEALHYLNGQFAFAIWNNKKKECFFARDRVGIRPLFYSNINGTLVFGSEIKSLFEFPGITRHFSPEALKEVFTFWTTLSPRTLFEGVSELPPGHCAWYRNGRLEIKKFWSLKYATTSTLFNGTPDEALDQFKYLLSDSVALRLRSDVPVAAYLSGGLDSSVTTALIKKAAPGHLNTFSIGFAENVFDETKYQNEVSQYFQTNHKSIVCSASDIADWFPKVVWHSEIPLLRTSPAPMIGLSKLVHEHGIKVVITGEGADEALAGYNIFKETLIRQFWARQPQSKIRPLLLKKLYPYLPNISQASQGMLRMFFGYKLEETDSPVYSHLLRWQNTSNIQKHFTTDLNEHLKDYNPIEQYTEMIRPDVEGISSLAKAQLIETNVFMSGYLLSSQGDRMAMANSVEGRYPFLDYRLLEFAGSLPDEFKLKGMNEKFLLKELMKNEIPKSVLNRHKQAYRAPILEAFIGTKVPDYVSDMISCESLTASGVFNPKSVNNLITKIKTASFPSEVDNMALVGILSTQLLFNLFIKDFRPLAEREILKGKVRNKYR
ncbi:MAG: asparagine synthase (glutamine-hydrolyzing) [Flavobacterium sp.]|nr:asparagine synthase (glutamine-hydrolyzing) [Flavobacterium sp.]